MQKGEVVMPIPAAKHVIYEINPLDNVICQIRFPTLLKIDTETPSLIQERLLPDYINFSESQALLFNIQVGGKSFAPGKDLGDTAPSNTKSYEFSTEDKRWTISLTRNSLSLSTSEYRNWGEFRSRFSAALGVFMEVYKPAIITRVGLRYIDIIVRSKLNIKDVVWDGLISKPIIGVLDSDIKNKINEFQSTFSYELNDKLGVVKVSVGTVKSTESGETCFMVDSDYFNLNSMKPDEILGRIDAFHSKAYDLFRWCITEKLHNAMKPRG